MSANSGHLPPAPTGLTFTAYGIVAGQGSKRHVGNGVMIEQSKRVKPWRDDKLVAQVTASKVYGVRPGARIHVEPIGGAS